VRIRVDPNFIAVLLAGFWVILVFSDSALHHPRSGLLLSVGLYLLTCIALIAHARSTVQINLLVKAIAMMAAVLVAFTAYGSVLASIQVVIFPKTAPHWLRFAGLLIPALSANVILGLIWLVPAQLLLQRWSFLIPTLVLAVVWALQRDSASVETIGSELLRFEWACLFLIQNAILLGCGSRVQRWLLGLKLARSPRPAIAGDR